ncbi:MAG: SNF2-related protein [Lachnospiraceae bacterium]|nr:SNF2-related protein [Lachnospiraceae bacterium]
MGAAYEQPESAGGGTGADRAGVQLTEGSSQEPKHESRNEAEPGLEFESENEAEPESETEPESESENEVEREPEPEPEIDTEPETESEKEEEPKADIGSQPEKEPESALDDTPWEEIEDAAQTNPFEEEDGKISSGRYEQMSFLFPSEAEQIEVIDRAAESEKPSAFSLPQSDIAHFLRLGGKTDKSRMVVAAEYMKGKSGEKIVETLRDEYQGGMGILTDNGRMSAWFGEEGISLARGDHARFASQHQLLTWEDAAARIGELMDAGAFATNVELAETEGYSRSKLAEWIWYMRRDFSEMTEGVPLLTTLDEYRGGGFPEEIEKISSAMTDPGTLGAVTRDMLVFSAAYKNNPGILRFHYHNVPRIVEQLQDLAEPWKAYTSEMAEVPKAGQFITEDEIDDALAHGSGVQDGKVRIYSFFSRAYQPKEAVAFLRREYGIGGHSGGCRNKFMSYENHDGKGIQLTKQGCSDVAISWNAVVKRIEKLIRADRYLTDKEKRQMEQIREAHEEETEAEVMEPEVPESEMGLASEAKAFDKPEPDEQKAEPKAVDTAPEKAEDTAGTEASEDAAPEFGTVGDSYSHYYSLVRELVLQDTAYRNACRNSDRENAMIEGNKAVRRAVFSLKDLQLYRLYFDNPKFQEHLINGILAETYPQLLAEFAKELKTEQAEDLSDEVPVEKEPAEKSFTEKEPRALEDRFRVVEVDDENTSRRIYAVWDDQTGEYHKDADGLVTDFVSRQDAEQYRQEVIWNLREEASRSSLDKAKNLINTYCVDEFSSEADFSDMTSIGVGYTTVADRDLPIEVTVNLVEFRLERRLNDRLIETRQYDSLEALIAGELEHLDFDELTSVSEEEVAAAIREVLGEEAPVADEVEPLERTGTTSQPETSDESATSDKAAFSYGTAFPYRVGDTVNLEDGRPFVIESIGMFDVQLRDPALRYPVFRSESRESFLRLMERYPQNLSDEHENPQSGWKQNQAQVHPEVTEETTGFYPAGENGLPYDVEIRRLRFDEPNLDEPEQEAEVQESESQETEMLELEEPSGMSEPVQATGSEADIKENASTAPSITARNFRITDDHLGEGGPKQKYSMNVAAIRTLLTLEKENRDATPEEQETLSRYVGWGSLADVFDPNKPAWAQEYRELKGLLSDDEYAAARASTLNAHYTSPTVIRAIYEAVGRMGFTAGNILEPSMGVGNFFGLLPESMQGSRLYGVELDSITGRIAQKLYPEAEIKVAGFETTDRRDFYDLAVGNVPFGDYKVNDRPYNKLGFSIHNYFFAKALDQVRPGGVVAFVTSRYTMDAKSPDVRKYLAQRAELLGAIRLPNNAFRANAGTEVVSDIIFLQKRQTPIEIEPDWVHLGQTADGLAINSYFIDHPEMVMGELATESTQYGREECTVVPIPGADLGEQLHEAISHIRGVYEPEAAFTDVGGIIRNGILDDDGVGGGREVIQADPDVKNFSYAAVDGEVYFRENSIMRRVDMNETAKQRVIGMIGLRQIVNELIAYQMEDYPDAAIHEKQQELETAYDKFTAEYGILNSRANARLFADDSSYYLLCSLENVDEDGNLISKADMFTKRTIRPDRSVTSVDTPVEALAVSIGEHGKVDLPFMSELLGTPGEYGRITEELSGIIFRDPFEASETDETVGWHTADDYLSGDVRAKLQAARLAAKTDPFYDVNVSALEKAQPKDLEASEIDVRLGATWIDKKYIQQFMEETFEPPFYIRRYIEVKFSPRTAEWQISGKTMPDRHDVAAYVTYGTDRANAYRILEETLNLKDIRIYDTVEDDDGKQKRVLNKKETTLAQQKQQAIKDAFQDWIWKDPRRRTDLCRKYNELFNSTRPREYDGSHIHFVGMNPEITLREHQKNAIAHVLYGGNTLLAHEVGAGKTFEMAAAAMESKRLGLCQKSLFVVPNHLTMQWANEFLRLYPSAKLLVATRRDFETSRRKKFCARIATGDYDAVIIGHSQFEKIPMSIERQERELREQIDEIEEEIASLKMEHGEKFTIKQMEKSRRSLKARLEKLLSTERKDDVVTFEQLGVDRLFVDESQAFKNLFLYTKMRNVAGLATSEAQKSSDMYMKCRYLDEVTGGRGVIFATGTPVSNSMTELYTVMRYLQYGTLQKKGLTNFDCWASTFGETTTAIELAPEGTGYRARTRFAKFFNLPELMAMFKEVADIKTSDELDLPVPDAKFETVVVKPSDYQKKMVQQLSERAAAVHAGTVDASVDNMLCITSDGRKIGLDQRLMNPLLPDDPGSKLNACVNNVFRIWQEGTPGKLTQLLFCDMSTPKKDGNFNVYDDIRSKLENRGVPHDEIAFIHDADTETKKKELFAKVRSGQVRVLLGSTQKMGAGTNVQDRLIAVHHLDVGWRPADMTQRNGRIIRQGNQNKEVQVYQYVTEGTFDAYLYQTLENKQKFISQIMTSKSPVRSCDDVDEQALSYAEIKALCAGSPLIKEKMDLDVDVARLKVLKADYRSKQYRMEDQLLKYFPEKIEKIKSTIQGLQEDIAIVEAHPHPKDGFAGMTVAGKTYTERVDAGEAILTVCKNAKSVDGYPLGSYRGFQMELSFDSFSSEFNIALKGHMTHRTAIGSDARGNIMRIDNALNNISIRLTSEQNRLGELEQQRDATQEEVRKPFPQEAELAEKSARLAELDAELNMEGSGKASRGEASQEEAGQGESGQHSVLADLRHKAGQVSVSQPRRDSGCRRQEVL